MGRAVAEILAGDGANVAVMARGREALDDTVAALQAVGSPDAVGLSVDMTDPGSIREAYAELHERWGSLNILVHTVGPRDGTFEQLDDEGWAQAFTLGTMSAVRNVRAALPLLRAAAWGRIAIFSAHSIQRQSPRLVAYTASKAAVTSLAKNLAKSLAPEGILVNAVCPGTIVTASFTENLKEIFAADNLDPSDPYDVMAWIDTVFHQPADLGRAGLPDEVASLTAYLVSRRNGYVTGACVNADGGSDFV
jgi:NAD(P)-dependent dehydrogenase (short-subunit alcohol dehydrogenase family)